MGKGGDTGIGKLYFFREKLIKQPGGIEGGEWWETRKGIGKGQRL